MEINSESALDKKFDVLLRKISYLLHLNFQEFSQARFHDEKTKYIFPSDLIRLAKLKFLKIFGF